MLNCDCNTARDMGGSIQWPNSGIMSPGLVINKECSGGASSCCETTSATTSRQHAVRVLRVCWFHTPTPTHIIYIPTALVAEKSCSVEAWHTWMGGPRCLSPRRRTGGLISAQSTHCRPPEPAQCTMHHSEGPPSEPPHCQTNIQTKPQKQRSLLTVHRACTSASRFSSCHTRKAASYSCLSARSKRDHSRCCVSYPGKSAPCGVSRGPLLHPLPILLSATMPLFPSPLPHTGGLPAAAASYI